MPARDANEDAVALLERRRAQNRQAQARFRQKKLAQQAAEAAAASPSTHHQAAAKSIATKRRRSDESQQPATNQEVNFIGGGSISNSSSRSSFGSGSKGDANSMSPGESDKASSPSTAFSSTSPSSASEASSSTSPTSYFASLSGQQSSSAEQPTFSYPSPAKPSEAPFFDFGLSPSAAIVSAAPSAENPAASSRTAFASYDDHLGDIVSSSAAMSVDNEVQFFASVMREAEQEQEEMRRLQQQQTNLQRQRQHQQPQQQKIAADQPHSVLDRILADFGVPGSSTPSLLSGPTQQQRGDPSLLPSQPQSQPQPAAAQSASSSSSSLCPTHTHDWFAGFNQWQMIETITNERGMLAVVLLLLESPSLEHLRRSILDPRRGVVFNEKHAMAKAFFHNAVCLGFLDDDLRKCATHSNISEVWTQRSLPFVQMGSNSTSLVAGGATGRAEDGTVSPLSLTQMPGTSTSIGKSPWQIPVSLSRVDEDRRLTRLREAPNMYPTALQLSRPHSIIIDTLPWPSVRDGLIRLLELGVVDNHTLKCDLIGKPFECSGEGHVFTLHGDDPMDPESWEMSEYWAQKYLPLLDRGMVRRTNFWRRMKGLDALRLDKETVEREGDRTIVDALANLRMAGV